jgi:hypothetical protein
MGSCRLSKRSVKSGIVRCRMWLVWRAVMFIHYPNSPLSKIISLTHTHTHNTYIHMYIHTYTLTYTYIHTYIRIYTFTHTYVRTHIHTHTHTHTHYEKLFERFPFLVESTWRRMCLKHDRVASAENRRVLSITRDFTIPLSQWTHWSPSTKAVRRLLLEKQTLFVVKILQSL